MNDGSYDQFRGVWESRCKAEAYRDARFSRSKRWRWTAVQEHSVVSHFLSPMPGGARVLDIPCGAGRFVSLIKNTGISYWGADYSTSMVHLVKEAFGSLMLLGGDALRLPFSNGAFDAIISVRLLHRIKEQETRVKMLMEMARVSKGPLLVTYYTKWNMRGVQRWLRGKYPGISLSRIREDARLAGLRIDQAIPLRRWTQQQWFFHMTPG